MSNLMLTSQSGLLDKRKRCDATGITYPFTHTQFLTFPLSTFPILSLDFPQPPLSLPYRLQSRFKVWQSMEKNCVLYKALGIFETKRKM